VHSESAFSSRHGVGTFPPAPTTEKTLEPATQLDIRLIYLPTMGHDGCLNIVYIMQGYH